MILIVPIVLSSLCLPICIIGYIYSAIVSKEIALQYAKELFDSQPEYAAQILGSVSSMSSDAIMVILTIFAVIVTIWVALNVYNIISKNDINELEDRLNDMIKNTEKLYSSLEEKSRFEFSIAFHGSYLEYTGTDYILLHLKEVTEEKQDIKLVEEMEKLERLYSIAMIEYYNMTANDTNEFYKTAIDSCRAVMKYVEEIQNPHLLGYVYLRLANLYYFQSNINEVEILWKTIKYTLKASDMWFGKAKTEPIENLCSNYTNRELYSLIDIHNLIGITACHIYNNSKAGSDDRKKSREMMMEYYELLRVTIEKTDIGKVFPKRLGLYYRNIGTSYDFAYFEGDKKEITEEAVYFYKKAIEYRSDISKLYRNVAAFRLKQFEFNHICLEDKTIRLNYLNELITYGTIYRNMEPYNREPYIYLRAGYYLKYKENKDEKDKQSYEENANILLCLTTAEDKKKMVEEANKCNKLAGCNEITIDDLLRLKEHGYNRAIKQYI